MKKKSIFPFKVSFGEEADRQAIEYRLRKDAIFGYLDVDLKQTETKLIKRFRESEKHRMRKKELDLG